jgi:hypothetical protein
MKVVNVFKSASNAFCCLGVKPIARMWSDVITGLP